MVFSRNDGTFHREIDRLYLKWTVTNVETGTSIAVHAAGTQQSWVNHDGVMMLATMGRALVGYTGRVLIDDSTGEILRTTGHFVGDIAQVFCDPLAP